jgi:hypothetical protein
LWTSDPLLSKQYEYLCGVGQGIEIGGFGEDGLWRNLKRLPRIDPALDVAQTSFATQLV